MTEFAPCDSCLPDQAKDCAVLRELLGLNVPEFSVTLDFLPGEHLEPYAHRLAAHCLAVQVMKWARAGCTEFAPDAEALRAPLCAEEALDAG